MKWMFVSMRLLSSDTVLVYHIHSPRIAFPRWWLQQIYNVNCLLAISQKQNQQWIIKDANIISFIKCNPHVCQLAWMIKSELIIISQVQFQFLQSVTITVCIYNEVIKKRKQILIKIQSILLKRRTGIDSLVDEYKRYGFSFFFFFLLLLLFTIQFRQ